MISFKFGAEQPKKRLRLFAKRFAGAQVTFGYRSPYAVYVHENLEMRLRGRLRPSRIGAYWDAENGPGESKYLEKPFREMANDGSLQRIITQQAQETNISDGVRKAAEHLLARSRMIVPSEYGDLRKSGYISEIEPLGTQEITEAKRPRPSKSKTPTSLTGRAWQGLKRIFGFGKK